MKNLYLLYWRHFLLRLYIVFLLCFVVSCAPVLVPVVNEDLIKVSESVSVTESLPQDFEKSLPSSLLMRRSLVVFDKTYPRVYSDTDVLSVAVSQNMAAILKPGEVGFTVQNCSSLLIDGDFYNIWASGYDVLLTGASLINYYSARDCVRYSSMKKALKGPAVLAGKYIIEWEEDKVVLRDAFTGSIYYNGTIGAKVSAAGLIGGIPSLVLYNRYIMGYDEVKKIFSLSDIYFPLDFENIFFAGGVFYGALKTGEYFAANDSYIKISQNKNCSLNTLSPYALCGDILESPEPDVSYKNFPKSDFFAAGAGLYATLDKNSLNIYSLKEAWQRFVTMGFEMPSPCSDENGAIYFTGFSGNIYRIYKGVEKIVKRIPDKCYKEKVTYRKGRFVCGKENCGAYAVRINSDSKSVMYRRTEEGKQYYFFENLED